MTLNGKSVKINDSYKTVGEKLGDGAEGAVYAIRGNDSSVVKIFNEDERASKKSKVRAMLKDDNRPVDPAEQFKSIIWPEYIVEDAEGFLGYQMPRLDLNDWEPASMYAMSLEERSLRERLRPAYNLAYMVYRIHRKDHALGDFNEDNIYIKDGYVSLLDCDGFHISSNNTVYEGETFSPRYAPPEKRPEKINEVREADYFCLAVHIFQFLMNGWHPYAATGPSAEGGDWAKKIEQNLFPYTDSTNKYHPPEDGLQQQYNRLPQEIQDLFEQCFSQGSTSYGWGRIDAEEWAKTLGRTNALDVPEEKLPSNNEPNHPPPTPSGSGKTDIEETAKEIINSQWEETDDRGDTAPSTAREDDDSNVNETADEILSKWDENED